MKTRQYFQAKRFNAYSGSWEDWGNLLLPSDVDQFKELVSVIGFDKAFTRMTGKNIEDFRDIRLVQEFLRD